ncbi:MAG: MFS transporter [Mycobacterium sp.]|jgi:MFS family permease
MTAGGAGPGTGYELFGQKQFRNVWTANLVYNLGLVMLSLGAAWTMTSLTDSAVLVSMVQTMSSLPFVLFAIPLGVATDAIGHRTMMIASQLWMLVVTGALSLFALPGGADLTPKMLLAAVFLVGIGTVVQQSSWKPYLYELVPKDKVVAALSFNSLSSDIGRAIGPIIGGILMRYFGPPVVLFTSAVSHLFMMGVLKTARSGQSVKRGEAGSLRQTWQVLVRSPQLYGPMIRTAMVMVTCGTVLGLLPLEAKENIQTGPIGYGELLAALAIGSAAGAVLTPVLKRHVRLNLLSAGAVAVLSLAVIGISQWDSMLLDASFLFFYGCSWSIVSITHLSSVQLASPESMRGLVTAIYALAVQGSMALGSFSFGLAAHYVGVSRSILIAGLFAMSGLLLVRRFPLADVD